MSLRPPGVLGSSGPEAVELAAACGLYLDDWQVEELYWALTERHGASWAAAVIALILSRQNGKNCIVEVRELFGLVMLGERVLHTAHLFPTARESFLRLEALVEANPDVQDQLIDRHASPASGYDMVFRSGGRIQYIARSRTSGRGFDGIDLLVLDEAQDLNDDALGALLPTISSKPNAQTWYQGSAPGFSSTVLHRIRKQGRDQIPGRMSYGEYSADPSADLDDRAAWRQANPAFPHRISEETIESERRSMSDEMFARERLSISPDLLEAGGPFGEKWAAVCNVEAESAKEGANFALDVNPERSAAAIAAFGGVVEMVDYCEGTGWLLARAAELHQRYHGPFVVDARGPAASFIPELERLGIVVTQLQSTEMARATGDFFDAVMNGEIVVRSNPDLDRAVAGAAKKSVGDAFVWARRSSSVDICPLVAATMAARRSVLAEVTAIVL